MSRLLEWIECTPLVQKAFFFGLFLVLLGGGFYGFIAVPTIDKTEKLRGEVQSLNGKLKLYSASENQYRLVEKELSRLEFLVNQWEKRLGLEVPMRSGPF